MAQVVDLNELVGEDVVFRYGKPVREYAIPGDISTDTVFALFEMYLQSMSLEGDDPQALLEQTRRKFSDINGRLLELFQVRDPKLKELPFGIKGTGIVLRTILKELGVSVDPGKAQPPSRAPKRKAAKKKTAGARRKR